MTVLDRLSLNQATVKKLGVPEAAAATQAAAHFARPRALAARAGEPAWAAATRACSMSLLKFGIAGGTGRRSALGIGHLRVRSGRRARLSGAGHAVCVRGSPSGMVQDRAPGGYRPRRRPPSPHRWRRVPRPA